MHLGHKGSKSTDSLGFGSWPSHPSLIVSSCYISFYRFISSDSCFKLVANSLLLFNPRTGALHVTIRLSRRQSFIRLCVPIFCLTLCVRMFSLANLSVCCWGTKSQRVQILWALAVDHHTPALGEA